MPCRKDIDLQYCHSAKGCRVSVSSTAQKVMEHLGAKSSAIYIWSLEYFKIPDTVQKIVLLEEMVIACPQQLK